MADDPLIELVRRYVSLRGTEAEAISAAWGEPVAYEGRDIILAPGRTCRALYFMDEGYARFYTESDGHDVTRHFVLPGLLFTVSSSFESGLPAREGLQTLTSGRVRRLGREANAALAAACPPWDRFRQGYVRAVYAYLDSALDEARYRTAAERYESFVESYPEVVLDVPLHYVASYLGMTPQSLSRIRAGA